MNVDELARVVDLHNQWIHGEDKGIKANLTRANLSGANLSGADLTDANLRGANLTWADLTDANLTDVNLSGADLSGADLTDVNLSGADLSGVNLRGAHLIGAHLSSADLTDANLRGAHLIGAALTAPLTRANLTDAVGPFSVFSGGRDFGIAHCTHISIGCERHSHADWRERYAEIGHTYGYTAEEIERYRSWIFSLDWLIELAVEKTNAA